MKIISNTVNLIPNIKGNDIYKRGEYIEFDPVLLTFTKDFLHNLILFYDGDREKEYYDEIRARLKHIDYKYEKGWITSSRQRIILDNDCISVVQRTPSGLSAYIRSSNIDDLLMQDVAALATMSTGDLQVFIAIPHSWNNNKTKLEQDG